MLFVPIRFVNPKITAFIVKTGAVSSRNSKICNTVFHEQLIFFIEINTPIANIVIGFNRLTRFNDGIAIIVTVTMTNVISRILLFINGIKPHDAWFLNRPRVFYNNRVVQFSGYSSRRH